MTTKLTLSNSFMNNQELKDLRDKTIENTTDETTWGGTVKLEEIEEAMKEVRRLRRLDAYGLPLNLLKI